MNYPHDDESMVYDRTMHKYILTPQCVYQELGINLNAQLVSGADANPSTLPERFLKRVSNTLYNFIYSHTTNKMYVEWVLAKCPEAREVIKECLVNEVLYTLKSGELNESGINLTRGSSVERRIMRERLVSVESERLLEQDLPDGTNLLYRGYIQPPMNMRYREDY